MTFWKEAEKSLVDYIGDVGTPEWLVTDGATKFTGRHIEFIKEARMCARCYKLQNMDIRIKVMWQGNGRARDQL